MLSVMLFIVIFLALLYAICCLIKKLVALFPKKVVFVEKKDKGTEECQAE